MARSFILLFGALVGCGSSVTINGSEPGSGGSSAGSCFDPPNLVVSEPVDLGLEVILSHDLLPFDGGWVILAMSHTNGRYEAIVLRLGPDGERLFSTNATIDEPLSIDSAVMVRRGDELLVGWSLDDTFGYRTVSRDGELGPAVSVDVGFTFFNPEARWDGEALWLMGFPGFGNPPVVAQIVGDEVTTHPLIDPAGTRAESARMFWPNRTVWLERMAPEDDDSLRWGTFEPDGMPDPGVPIYSGRTLQLFRAGALQTDPPVLGVFDVDRGGLVLQASGSGADILYEVPLARGNRPQLAQHSGCTTAVLLDAAETLDLHLLDPDYGFKAETTIARAAPDELTERALAAQGDAFAITWAGINRNLRFRTVRLSP